MTKEEIAKQFEAIKKQRGNANKPAPKLVFTDPLYHKARVLEGAGMVSADKPLPSASLVEKAKMHELAEVKAQVFASFISKL